MIDQIVYDHLFRACPRCQGRGQVTETYMRLIRVRRRERTRLVPCPICQGGGRVLTPFGHELVAFLKAIRRHAMALDTDPAVSA